MRSREAIVNSALDIVSDLEERVAALQERGASAAVIARADRLGAVTLTAGQRFFTLLGQFLEHVDTELQKPPPSRRPPRASNVFSLRPGRKGRR